MPIISQEKQNKIIEQILFLLYNSFPKSLFISTIAQEIARDEEFVKRLMDTLLKKHLVIKIDKNPKGFAYSRRSRWRLSTQAQQIYSSKIT
jgi:predicted transcriptional regulator with HTH domain